MTTERDIDCIVAGDANVDLLIDGVVKLKIGAEQLAQGLELTLGGSSTITAFNLSRMNRRVAFAGLVGDDLFGRFVCDALAEGGVDTSALAIAKSVKTGLTIWHSKQGERAGLTFSGSIAQFRASHVPLDLLRRARHLHVGAYFLITGFHRQAPALFRTARQAGLTTSLDSNYDPSERWDSGIRRLLRETDIFLPNEAEALRITRRKTVEKAALDLAGDVRFVVIKLGARGALLCGGDHMTLVKAPEARVVDTTGAGDSFNAGFLAQFVREPDLVKCVRAGVAAGSRCVSRRGGTTAFRKR